MDLKNYLDMLYKKAKPEDVTELILDQRKIIELSHSDKELLEKYKNAELFSMIDCGLRSLKNLPVLSNLDTLELSENRISGEELEKITIYQKLYKLKLSNNPINIVSELTPLKNLKELAILDISNSPITRSENYRDEVFKLLPQLEVLDMQYKGGMPYETEDDEDFDEMFEEQEEMVGEDNDDFIDDENLEEDEEEDENDIIEDEDIKPSKKRKLN